MRRNCERQQRTGRLRLRLTLQSLILLSLTSCTSVRIERIETSAGADRCAASILDDDPATIPDDGQGCREMARVYARMTK